MKVMVNFQLGKLNVKDEIINNDTSVGHLPNTEHRAGALSTELRELMESEAILELAWSSHTFPAAEIDMQTSS